MNKGLAAATGTYIAFLNADDWYEPDTLRHMAALITPATDCIAGAVRVHHRDGSVVVNAPREKLLTQLYPPAMPAGHQAWFACTELLQQLGGFNTAYTLAADYDLVLHVQKLSRIWAFTPEVLANFTLGGASYALIPTAREYRQAKRANGDRLTHAWAVCLRNILVSAIRRSFPPRQ